MYVGGHNQLSHGHGGQGIQNGRVLSGQRPNRHADAYTSYVYAQHQHVLQQQRAEEAHAQLQNQHYQEHQAQMQAIHNGYSENLSNSTPHWSPNNMHNAQVNHSSHPQHNEHWNEQLRLWKDSREVHHASTTMKITNHAARQPHKVKQYDASQQDTSAEEEYDDSARPSNQPVEVNRQEWDGLDLGGHGLVSLSSSIFMYKFLHEIYMNSNRLTFLPKEIGTLRQLRFLDLSHNQLTELPPELGMCTFLEGLMVFDNQIRRSEERRVGKECPV